MGTTWGMEPGEMEVTQREVSETPNLATDVARLGPMGKSN